MVPFALCKVSVLMVTPPPKLTTPLFVKSAMVDVPATMVSFALALFCINLVFMEALSKTVWPVLINRKISGMGP